MSSYALAAHLRVPRTRIERLVREETQITPDTALRLARYLGTTAEFWLRLQARYDLALGLDDDQMLDEVKRQLNSLERQAKKAQQYKVLQNEKRELALTLVAADYATLTAQAEEHAAELTRLRDGEAGLRTRLSGLAAREAGQRELLQASDHRLSDLRQAVQKVQGELERLLERREQMGVQAREMAEMATAALNAQSS